MLEVWGWKANGAGGDRKAVAGLLMTDAWPGEAVAMALNAATGSLVGERREREERPEDWLSGAELLEKVPA